MHCEQTQSRMATFGLPCQLSVVIQRPYTGQRSWPYPPLSLLKGTIVPLQRVINCFSYKDWIPIVVCILKLWSCKQNHVLLESGVGISSLDTASKRLWEVEESSSLFTKPLLHKIFQHFLFQKKDECKRSHVNILTIYTLCFSNTSSPTMVRISSPTAPTRPP